MRLNEIYKAIEKKLLVKINYFLLDNTMNFYYKKSRYGQLNEQSNEQSNENINNINQQQYIINK